MVIGAGVFVLSIAWFAHGEPMRQFPGFRARAPRRSDQVRSVAAP